MDELPPEDTETDGVSFIVNVNTNKIEGKWAHLRRADANEGGRICNLLTS